MWCDAMSSCQEPCMLFGRIDQCARRSHRFFFFQRLTVVCHQLRAHRKICPRDVFPRCGILLLILSLTTISLAIMPAFRHVSHAIISTVTSEDPLATFRPSSSLQFCSGSKPASAAAGPLLLIPGPRRARCACALGFGPRAEGGPKKMGGGGHQDAPRCVCHSFSSPS